MDRSPSRLRNAGGSVASGVSVPSERQYGEPDSLVRRNTRAADHARGQVLTALDGLLGDDVPLVDGGRTPGQAGVGGRGSRVVPEELSLDAHPDGQLSPTRKASAVPVDGSGYTPTAAGGRRRRSSVRSPKSYNMGVSQGQGVQISTLEGLQVFLDEKQKEVVKAHARRSNELETTLLKEETYFSALLDNELEQKGVKLKATSAMLKGGESVANNLFRRGSRRLSKDGVDDALLSKHSDDVRKAFHLRKKLKAHHDEARIALAKKLQVESARMGRVIKTNLGKYANPKLAQSAKAAVLASVVEYLNGEEFVRIVTAPLSYKSPDFVSSTEAELGVMGVSFSPTSVRQRSMASMTVEAVDYDSKMAQLQEKRVVEQQQRMADEALRHRELLERENRAAMEQDSADALAKAHNENLRRQEEMQRKQDEELEEQRRQLNEHQEHLRREAELARMRHKEELDRRRAEMEREREAVLAQQAEAKRLQEEELSRQREEMQRQHDEDMERQRKEIARHAEEVARHKTELAKHNEEARLEQEALEQMRRRAKEEEEGERRRLEGELAKHQEEMRFEAERVKMELEALKLERESAARAEEAERPAEEEASRTQAAAKAAEDLRAAREEEHRKASEAAIRAQVEAELEERVARDIQAERDRVAAESAALQAKIREFEEQRVAAAKQAAVEEEARRTVAEREVALVARERVAAEKLALGRALSEKARLGATTPNESVLASGSLTGSQGLAPGGYRAGDKVEALCTPVGAAVGTKAYISGEVAHRNPDGSLDIILSDGRMRPDVPLGEIRFIDRPGPPSSAGSSISDALTQSDSDGGDVEDGSEAAEAAAAWAASARVAGGDSYGGSPSSTKHLLDQTQSFGSMNGGETDEGLQDGLRNPQRTVKSGSLDDILANKVGGAAEAEQDTSSHKEGAGGGGDHGGKYGSGDRGSGDGGAAATHKTAEGGERRAPAKKRVSLDEIMGIKVGQVVKGSVRTILQEGDTVEALDTSPDGSSVFKPGVISCIHGDGRVDIDLEIGRKLVNRPAKEVRLVRKSRGSSAAVTSAALSTIAPEDLVVGDRVEARYAGKPEYCPGVVTSTEDGVSVNFDGGWHGASIPLRNVRRLGPSHVSRAHPQGGRAKPPPLSAGAQLRSTGCILDLDVGSLGEGTFSIGDQVQFRNKLALRKGPPETHNGVIRTAHPNGSYLVGLENNSTRDQVLASFLTNFEWTTHGSEAFRRAATGNSSGVTPASSTSPAKQNAYSGVSKSGVGGLGGAGGQRGGTDADSSVSDRNGLSKSLRKSLFDKFGSPAKVVPEGALRWTAGKSSGPGGGDGVPQRRATHDGVVESGELGLRVHMMHFRPEQFMDPDTAAQAILTPNNAGMFSHRGRQGRLGGGRHQMFSELSSNSSTDDSDSERGDGTSDKNHNERRGNQAKGATSKSGLGSRASNKKEAAKESSLAGFGNAPKRRMTFGGIRSDKRGEVYKAQRRPSFLDEVGRRAVQAAEATAKLARRISIQGNNGQGFELVAIRDRKESANNTTGRKRGRGGEKGGDVEDSSDSELCENQTHFYNRTRHVFEPQHMEIAPSAWWIRTCGVVNLICMAAYLWWRCMRSLIGVNHIIWAYIFLTAECIMAIGMIVGHSSRSFPVHREKVYMDDLTEIDDAIGALKVAVLVPTCGEKTAVMLKALFGNLQLRLWKSRNARRETLRIVVLDEKRREEVQKLVSLVYTLAEVVLDKIVREILMREGVAPISAKGFYDHFANGEHGQRMYDDVNFIRGIEIVSEIDKLIAANDDTVSRFSPSVAISRIKERARRASCFDRKEIQPGQKKVWNRNKYIPTIVYYSRIDAGQPRISPKAGNMNRAIFSFNPQEEPLIGQAAVVVVNDVRHELYPEFLQRTVPYFFTFDKVRRCYKWANIAFIQTPQRFHDRDDWNDPDPLGNQAATQFDIVNCGRDGAGGALSCGQGSLWRVQVLRDGIRPDGSKFIKKGLAAEDQVGRQGGLGFRAEVLIEDTHTSIDLFRQGWRSVYVNFPKEILACCTLPPDTVKWRWKQVLRWHQGAVQLAMWKGWKYAIFGENWGTLFQKVFAFDAVSYFLQAFAGEILLIFPVVYGFTNSAPFNTWNIEFALYFFPFIITGILPTVAALGWQKTPSAKVMRDEQIWFATSFVQIYAVLHAVWGTITRKDPSNAWECKCPVWPLHAHFVAIFGAVCYNTADWAARSYEEPWVWVSCIGSAMFALHSLWPVVSFGLGVTMPEAFYTRVFGMLVVMTLVSMWLLGESG